MLHTIRGRLALHFTLLIAGLLVLMLSLTAWLAYRLIDELRPSILGTFEETQTLNEKNVLLNSASYLSERLYPFLQTLNVSALDAEIAQIKNWLPIQSFVVADLAGRIVTDGSRENPRYGEPLSLPDELLPQQPILYPLVGESKLLFVVALNDQVAGYAVVTLSDAALRTSLGVLDEQVTALWEGASRSFLVGAGLLSLLLGAFAPIFVWRLSRTLSQPVSEMIEAAEAYAGGNLDIALPVRSDDELGHLALALNTMAQELKVSHRRMRHLANYDALTGLPNRHLFQDRLRHALNAADRSGHRLGLLFLDLDGFKAVNDTLGHGFGDEILRLIATRLRRTVRACDTVARLGGDEFTVIAEGLRQSRDVEVLANKLLAALTQPYLIQEQSLYLSASIGITIYPQDGADAATLLRNADSAMYLSKRQGKNTYRFFTPELDLGASERLGLQQGLRDAIERQEFELYYQPQVDARTGALVGAETLLRWCRPVGVAPPGEFLAALEGSGLMTKLTGWILAESCRTLAQWRARLLPSLRIAVNLSALQLEQPALLPMVQQILEETELASDALEIEITEATLLEAEHGLEVADRLHRLGIRLAIDDFGSGYSSIVSLKRLAVDKLKIDSSLVRGVPTDRESSIITAALIGLSERLDIETLAEGVESWDQWRALREQGCGLMQGYFIGRPLPADQFLVWAESRVARGKDWTLDLVAGAEYLGASHLR